MGDKNKVIHPLTQKNQVVQFHVYGLLMDLF